MTYTYNKQDFEIENHRTGWWSCFIQGYGNVKADTASGVKFMVRKVVDFLNVKS